MYRVHDMTDEEVDERHTQDIISENKELKARLVKLEHENRELRRSLYNLNLKLSSPIASSKPAFDIDRIISDVVSDAVINTTLPDDASAASFFSFKTDLRGHKGAVYAVKYAPSGRQLATGSFDGTIRLWDAMLQTEVRVLRGHTLGVTHLAWAPSSTRLISGSFDKTAKVWNTETGDVTRSYESKGIVQAVAASPYEANMFFFANNKKQICVVDDRNPESPPVLIMENDAPVTSLYVYRDGTNLLSGDALGNIKTWNLRTGMR